MNHSDRFWSLLRRHEPQTDAARRWLRAHAPRSCFRVRSGKFGFRPQLGRARRVDRPSSWACTPGFTIKNRPDPADPKVVESFPRHPPGPATCAGFSALASSP